ncbi:MAG: hypothetical protein H2061_04955, partial [Burkholderiales bacterium]|nr:hypothetical protein [Burkholderiales bacterium]
MKILISLFISFFAYINPTSTNAAFDGSGYCVGCAMPSRGDIKLAQASQSDKEFNPSQNDRRMDLDVRAFRSELMYKFLIAEFAKHNKLYDLAAETLVDILRSEERSDIAEMAADAANVARRLDLALEAAKVWFRLDPDSIKARFVYLTVILSNNEFLIAKPLVEDFLSNNESELDKKLQYVSELVARAQDR